MSQPTCVPVRPSCSRRNCTSSRRGSTSSSTRLPFTVRPMVRPTRPPRVRRCDCENRCRRADATHERTARPRTFTSCGARPRLDCSGCVCAGSLVATALLALSPTSAWASGGVWSPVRVAPVDRARQRRSPPPRARVRRHRRGRLDGERHRARGDARAGQALRRAARDRRELHAGGARRRRRPRHARARAAARPAGHRRHARRLLGDRRIRRRRPSRPPRRRRRSPRPRVGCAPTAARSPPTPSRSSPMTISSAARTPAGGWAPAGDVPLPASVTLVQQLQLVAPARRQRRAAVPRPGRRGGRRAAALRRRALGRRRVGGAHCARPGAPWSPAPTSGSQSTRPASSTRSGASPTAACAPRCCPLGGAFSAAQTTR